MRYIDADKLAKTYMMKGKDKLRIATVINELELAPTADVVPKREVEILEAELSRYTENLMQMREQDKQNIAREIFKEVEKVILDNTYPDFDSRHKPVNVWKATTGYDAFYELKKKYTEGVK